MNPFLTLTFFTLGKIDRWDAVFYALSHFVGGITGVLIGVTLIGAAVGHAAVNDAVTIPGSAGAWVAFGAEVLISLLMITTVLTVSNTSGSLVTPACLRARLSRSTSPLKRPIRD
jgi:aquaporin Z